MMIGKLKQRLGFLVWLNLKLCLFVFPPLSLLLLLAFGQKTRRAYIYIYMCVCVCVWGVYVNSTRAPDQIIARRAMYLGCLVAPAFETSLAFYVYYPVLGMGWLEMNVAR